MDGAEFLIALRDSMSGPATAAQNALSKLESQIRSEKHALTGLEEKLASSAEKMGGLKENLASAKQKLADLKSGKAPFDIKEYAKANNEFVKFKNAIDGAEKHHAKLSKAIGEKKHGIGVLEKGLPEFTALRDRASKGALNMQTLSEAAQQSGGSVGALANALSKLKSLGVAGLVIAIAVAIVAVGIAAIAATYAVAKFALGCADAARSARLLSNAAAGGVVAGAELEAVISDVASMTPLARDRIAEMGRALEVAHLSGRRMQNALESMATLASAIGDVAASKIQGIAEQAQKVRRFLVTKQDLEGTGLAFDELAAAVAEASKTTVAQAKLMIQQGAVSVDRGLEAMNAAIQKKFGKTVQAQMFALSTQMAKLKKNFALLFAGLDIEKFLSGLKEITDLFSQQTFTGQTLKKVLTEALNKFFDIAAKVLPYVKAFLQGIIIAALILYLYFKKVAVAISNAFGGESKSNIDWIKVAMYAGVGAVGALVGMIAGLILILGTLALSAALVLLPLALPFILPLVAIGLLIYAIYEVVEAFDSLGDIDLEATGRNIVNGLINGIKAMAGEAVGAIADLASKIKTTITGALGIHSPSVVFQKYGQYTAEGYKRGVDGESDSVSDSVEGMASARPKGAKRGKLSSGGPVTIILNIYAAMADAEIEKVRSALADLFEEDIEGSPAT